MYDVIEFLGFVGVVIAVTVVFVGSVVFGITLVERRACAAHQEITGQPTRYVFPKQCFIQHRGEWMRFSTYEQIVVAREGLASE